jgi:DHA3 family macrolide efflux protein-like MFS transporter
MSLANPPASKSIPLQLLRNNNPFRKYWFARLISMIGDRLYFLALPWLVLTITGGSVISTSITLALETIPLLFTLPFLGAAIDHYERRKFMLIADWLRGLIMAGLAVLVFTDSIQVYHVYIAAVLMSVLTEMFNTTAQAYLPSIVEKEDLLEANSNLASISSFLSTVGHLFSGLAIVLLTVSGSILVNSITFFLSGLLLLGVPKLQGSNVKKSIVERWSQIKEGFSYLLHHQTLFPLALFSAAMNLALVSTSSLLIFGAKEVIGLTSTETAIIFMIGGICSFTSTLLVKRIGKKLNKGQMIRFGSLGVLIGLFVLWIQPSLVTFAIGFAILVSISVFVGVSVMTYRQEIIPNELLGRVTASYQLFTVSTQPIAILGGGLLAYLTNIQTVFFVSMMIVAINVFTAWFGKMRHIA